MFRFYAACLHQFDDICSEFRISIENRITVRTRFPEGLPKLLHNPRAGGVFGDIKMEDASPAVFDDEETIQDLEGESRYGKEVHGRNNVSMVAQKGCPELTFLVGGDQAMGIPRNSAFRNLKTKLKKFAMNSRRSPSGILLNHTSDEGSNFSVNYGPANFL